MDKMWTIRKRGNAIGRVVTCHPTEGETYYLRLLLMNIRGPKSYQDLLTVNGKFCTSFREAAKKRGLLLSDNNLIECMSEAIDYQMPASLRHLFAMLLIYCSPSNPKELWENFEISLSEDFVRIPNISTKKIRYRVLKHINDILHLVGRDINEFKLIPEIIKASVLSKEAIDVYFERNIVVREDALLLENKLNIAQRRAYNIILDRIFSYKSGAFFIDGLGGTGKSFLYRALLATVRYRGFIALATASSGVTASLLPGGRTAHFRFKIPINIEGKFSCNISKQSSLASLIRDAKLIPAMAERLNINKIDKNTEEWTCKVQVVDKGHPRTNREGNKKYQLMILQDEEETQIQVVMYSTDTTHYVNEFVPFQTYLLSGAFVSNSTKAYENPLHQFTWTIDKGTIVEPIDQVIPPEPPLLPPMLLKATSFDSFDYQAIGFEFDIFALVINGSPSSYASNGSRIQKFIIIDYQCQFEVTIQDDTGSTTTMISDKIGELLSLVVAEIHDICCIKKHLLPLIPVQHKLLEKTFTIQIKKLFAKNKDASSAKLFIMSITKKDIVSNLPLPVTAPTTLESSKRKLKQIKTKED
ncbi:hypothetical protein H5410_062010 [Solanum commersonii]|uniref:ATP-dependent DNA helicase n=1 Tax=Solanum commersonii TaxID=4109 RepID=A0A9J5WAE3_SOLCO|nr:hypothetical protein H5410_062010 [Solanum commersonii]